MWGFVALSVACYPIPALPASCYGLSAERSHLLGQMATLVADYPGTHLVVGVCAATAQGEYEKTGSADSASGVFAGCAIVGCLTVGFSNCMEVTKNWFALSMQSSDVSRRLQQAGCP